MHGRWVGLSLGALSCILCSGRSSALVQALGVATPDWDGEMIRALVVAAAYVAAQMLADIASLKVVLFLGMSMDAGTFIYPITFTLRDLVHKTIGITAARVLIVTAAVINVVMAALFWWVSRMPGDPAVGPQTAFAPAVGGTHHPALPVVACAAEQRGQRAAGQCGLCLGRLWWATACRRGVEHRGL